LTDAKSALRRAEAELAAGTFGQPPDVSFRVFAEEWLASLRLRPNTMKTYRWAIGKLDFDCSVADVDLRQIERFKANWARSDRSLNIALGVLRQILQRAEDCGLATAPRVRRVRIQRREMDCLRPEEVRRLLEHAEHYPLLLTAVMTGLRIGELQGLRWGDLADGVLFVRRSYSDDYGWGETKTPSSRRSVNLTAHNTAVLEKFRGRVDERIFPLTRDEMDGIKDRSLRAAGLRHIRFHDLRHTYASLMLSLGKNIKYIQAQGGWATAKELLDTYGHLISESGASDGLDALVFDRSIVPFAGRRAAGQSKQGSEMD